MRLLPALVLFAFSLDAQQPFLTDDADVTGAGKFHLEVSNQFSFLQRSAFPNLRQNATVFQLNYGLRDGLELGVDSPLLAVFNAPERNPRTPVGNGDTNFTLKWNFRRESRWPAMTLACAVETPTGDAGRELGSGVADFGCNSIFQKSAFGKTVIRVNQGLLFSGNTLTGVVGVKAEGVVYTGAASITREIAGLLVLGVEIYGAVAQSSALGKKALQTQLGGKYAVVESMTIDFGVTVGRFAGSPRVGLQVGFRRISEPLMLLKELGCEVGEVVHPIIPGVSAGSCLKDMLDAMFSQNCIELLSARIQAVFVAADHVELL